jgi:outer membrane protein assembly factor BamB
MMNREWYSIAGNYPWAYGNSGTDYAGPFVTAPETSHVVWKRQGGIFGLVGGEMGQFSLDPTAVIGAAGGGNPTVIYSGRCYETFNKPGVVSVAECYDLRTGQEYYEIPVSQGGTTPQYISYTDSNVELLAISSGRLLKIDPWTGLVRTNVSLSPISSGTFYNARYFLTVQSLGTGKGYRLINWTSEGSASNITQRIMNNITWPWSSLGTVQDFNAAVAVQISSISAGGAFVGQTIAAASLTSGAQLWNTTIEEPYYSGSCNVADNGKVAVHNDRGYFRCFDLNTGQELWKSEQFEYPWDAPGFGAYDIASAYGLIFRSAYTGVYAVNWTNGKIEWKYESPNNPFETPYITGNGTAVSSWNGGILVADGKVYDYNTEHSPTQPITRGWKLHAINATTGKGIWNITAMSGSRDFRGAIADGYLAFDNFYDGYMYVFGKGKSATTVVAAPKTIAKGAEILIEGTVLDMSPGQPNTPCVSKNSMSTQMEYLHMQMPVDGIWHNLTMTGVPVTLTAISDDGNYINIDTVTSNAYYGTYEKAWTPPNEGTYQIVASFAGDAAYGSSGAQTAITVGPAQTTPPDNNQPAIVIPDYTLTIVGAAIAVIIAVAIVGALTLRKR